MTLRPIFCTFIYSFMLVFEMRKERKKEEKEMEMEQRHYSRLICFLYTCIVHFYCIDSCCCCALLNSSPIFEFFLSILFMFYELIDHYYGIFDYFCFCFFCLLSFWLSRSSYVFNDYLSDIFSLINFINRGLGCYGK